MNMGRKNRRGNKRRKKLKTPQAINYAKEAVSALPAEEDALSLLLLDFQFVAAAYSDKMFIRRMILMRIGFIGLGIMGRPMAENLIKAGHELVVVGHTNRKPVEELISEGAAEAKTPREAGEECRLVITMLPDSPQVREAALGDNGLIDGMKPGSMLIDMSSISPAAAQAIAEKLSQRGIRMMDAPVSGGEKGAVDGTLAIMAGGNESDFEEFLPVLKAMGSNVMRVGDVGAGDTVKLANQIIVAGNIAAMSEAFTLASKADVRPEVVYEAVKDGLAGSKVLDSKAPAIIEGNFDPGFKIKLHAKDLANVIEEAHAVGAFVPLTSYINEMMQNLISQGKGELDHSALIQFYKKLM